jgi:hypothetical protein
MLAAALLAAAAAAAPAPNAPVLVLVNCTDPGASTAWEHTAKGCALSVSLSP